MNTKLEELTQVRRMVTVEVPAKTVDKVRSDALNKMQKEVKMPGFRKGKVPDQMIEQRFGGELVQECIKAVVRETYPNAVAEAGVNPLGPPEIEPMGAFEKGKPFTYRAIFEVYPTIEVKGYEGIALEREKVDVSKQEVEAELKRLQQQMTQLEPAPEGELGEGMVAMIDFNGTAGGESFPGSDAENYVVDFGTGALLKEFEIQIKGMKANEERTIEFHYPKGYFRKEVAGKKGQFKVKAKEIRKKIVPEINDEFAKDLGEFKSLKAVRDDLKKRMLEYKEGMVKRNLMEQAMRKLIEENQSLEVPTALIDSELGNMLEQLKKQFETQGQQFDESKIDPKEFVQSNMKEATDRARGYMLVSAIAAKEGVDITDEELDQRIEMLAKSNRQPAAKVRQQMEKENALGNLRSQVVFEKTLDLVLSKAKIKEKKPKKSK